jgi:hypothetical protein
MTLKKLIEPSSYARRTRVTSQNASVLVRRMILAAPGDLNEDQRASLRHLGRSQEGLDDAKHRRALLDPGTIRPQLNDSNAVWGGISESLGAAERLPLSKKAARAARLRAAIFPDGAPYLQNDAETAYVEARDRLERIRREELGTELDEVIGPEYREAADKTTVALGDAIGVGRTPRPPVSNAEVQEALTAISLALAVYVRKLLADLDETDPRSVQRFLAAVAPLDQHRASMRARGETDEEPGEPDSPEQPETPEEPADPAA